MIVLELRNNEIRGIKTKGGLRGSTIESAAFRMLPEGTLHKLAEGDYVELKETMADLLSELDVNYESERYIATLNLQGAMTVKLNIPKVKPAQLDTAIQSAMLSENIAIGMNDHIAYAVMNEDKESKSYNVMAQAVDNKVIDNVNNLFKEMELNLVVLDLAPNSIYKAFVVDYESEDVDDEYYHLDLIVDLGPNELRYYQIHKKEYEMNYLDTIHFEDREYFMEAFKDNVRQILDEYGTYEEKNLNILLVGEEDMIEEIFNEYGERFNLRTVNDLSLNVDAEELDLSRYLAAIGASIRKDKYLSIYSKYDINLIDKNSSKSLSRVIDKGKLLVGVSVFSLILGYSYLGITFVRNAKLEGENETIEEYLSSEEVRKKVDEYELMQSQISAANSIVEVVSKAEELLKEDLKDINSNVLNVINKNAVVGSTIESISSENGNISINMTAMTEVSFMNYTQRLKTTGYFDKVTYSGYSQGDGEYAGVITAIMREVK